MITAENSEFRFTDNHRCYAVYSAQGVYQAVGLDEVKPNCERPLTVEIDGGPCVAVAEARLVDYARMRLRPVAGPSAHGGQHVGQQRRRHRPLHDALARADGRRHARPAVGT